MKNVIFQKNYLSKLLKTIIERLQWSIKVIIDSYAIQ